MAALLVLLLAAPALAEEIPAGQPTRFESYGGHVSLTLNGDSLAFDLRGKSGCRFKGDAVKSAMLTYSWTAPTRGKLPGCTVRFGIGAGDVRADFTGSCARLCKGKTLPPTEYTLPTSACTPKALRDRRAEADRALKGKHFATASGLYESLARECRVFFPRSGRVELVLAQTRAEIGAHHGAECRRLVSSVEEWRPEGKGAPAFRNSLAKLKRDCAKIPP